MAQDSLSPGLGTDYEIQPDGLVLTKRPIKTLKFFAMALLQYFARMLRYLLSHKIVLLVGGFVLFGWSALSSFEGPHEQIMREASAYMKYIIWWIGLGVLSSIGLGSGLHTFVLYLGPHIAMFTIKAALCGRVDLKSAPYDTALFGNQPAWEFKDCAEFGDPLFPKPPNSDHFKVPLLPILREVHWEAILWGVGTALGELPPYFVSRAAKLSGEKLRDYEDLKSNSADDGSGNAVTMYLNKLKPQMVELFEQLNFNRYRFWAILVLASVPNPLFDLAGIMCGQLLVPFWSFFIPTLIGKAFIKTHIQSMFVIVICNNQLVEHLENSVRHLFQHMPAVCGIISKLLIRLEHIQHKYHEGPAAGKETSWTFSIPLLWNTIVWIMIIGFLSSIINATAQSYVLEKQRKDTGKIMVGRS